MSGIEIIRIPAFTDNYLWLLHVPGSSTAIAIDPGDGAAVQQVLQRQEWQLTAILLTHRHHDHIGGVEILRQQYPNIPVYGPHSPHMPCVTQVVADGEQLHLADSNGLPNLSVLAVPGHTVEHIAYHFTEHSVIKLFSGDTLFAGGCGRLYDGDPLRFYSTLQALMQWPPNTEIYCAHEYTASNLRFALAVEPDSAALQTRYAQVLAQRAEGIATVPTTLAIELATNPFLRTHLPSIQAKVEAWRQAHAPNLSPATDPSTCFAAMRQWKTEFV